MTCASESLRVFWQAQLETKQDQLTEANATLTALLKSEIHSFMLDTTEGEQRVTQKRIDRLKEVIDGLEKEITQLMRRLQGCGNIMNLNLRRVI
jgi:peptidoglycan hydrolase CwlO-like protein